MGMFDGMKQQELQAECAKRELPAGGSNAEMIARLDQYEAEQLLGDGEDEATPAPPGLAQKAPEVDVLMPPPVFEEPPKLEQNTSGGPFTVAFPCEGELSTGMHEDFRMRAYNTAVAKGKVPRGGLAAAFRIGFRQISGTRCAIYEVALRK